MTTEEVNLLLERLGLHQVLHQSNMDINNKAATDLHRYYGYRFRTAGKQYDWYTKKSYSITEIEALIRMRIS